jgi:hypothetical protein
VKEDEIRENINNKMQKKPALHPKSPAYLLFPKRVFSFSKSLFRYRKKLIILFRLSSQIIPRMQNLITLLDVYSYICGVPRILTYTGGTEEFSNV